MNGSTGNTDYLTLLSNDYPTVGAVSSEIINLQAILNLPKGTEHFVSDLHGEYEAFLHVLKNASGVIKEKIDMLYKTTLPESERKELATLVYYPRQKLYYMRRRGELNDEWYIITLHRLIDLCKIAASKYTRSKVRKAMPKEFGYILEELLHVPDNDPNKHDYYTQIINSIIEIDRADAFVTAISETIQRLSIDRLHILGDIFDRGPRADIIMDELVHYHSLDICWGNHDIEWIGAAAGQEACIANVVRNSLRYNNFDILEIGYGINTRMLANFAYEAYADDPCESFMPLDAHKHAMHSHDASLAARMHKAISVIQFKTEGQIIARHPEYNMDGRALLGKIDINKKTVFVNGKEYPLTDAHFPTVDFSAPFSLTDGEMRVLDSLKKSFLHSKKLQSHIRFLINNGGMYKIFNGNLLYHGCIPLNADGTLASVKLFGKPLHGKAFLDAADKAVREAYMGERKDDFSTDFLWYLWCGNSSPLYGKESFTAFESHFTAESALLSEPKNFYYKYIDTEETCKMILREFSLDEENAHIINGHVPVRTGRGESPIKANGRLYVIDGGFSKPYQDTTGIAGYTLINNSYGFSITEHQPFTSVNDVIENNFDLHSTKTMITHNSCRQTVRDTDTGRQIEQKIRILQELLTAYRTGLVRERFFDD